MVYSSKLFHTCFQSADEVKELRQGFFTKYLQRGGPELKAKMEEAAKDQAEAEEKGT